MLKIVPPYSKEGLRARSLEVLKECESREFDYVVVIGTKGDTCSVHCSRTEDRYRIVGLFELAKQETMED